MSGSCASRSGALAKGSHSCLRSIEAQGHRSGVRAVALSSDDTLLISCAGTQVKVWSLATRAMLRTIETGPALCAAFAPGNRHAVVGTKDGAIYVLDVESSVVVAEEAAHAGAVWSVVPLPDGSGLVSCSSDRHVALWEWEACANPKTQLRQLGVRHRQWLEAWLQSQAVKGTG